MFDFLKNLSQSSNYVDKGTQESLQDALGNLYKTLWETFLKHHMLKVLIPHKKIKDEEPA